MKFSLRVALLTLFLLALPFLVASQGGTAADCKADTTCGDCVKLEGCQFCPFGSTDSANGGVSACVAKGAVCNQASSILDPLKCPPKEPESCQPECGEGQVCRLLDGGYKCVCANPCSDNQCRSTCSSDQFCESANNVCKCRPGYELEEGKCVSRACGNFANGCGNNAVCNVDQCVCTEGYEPIYITNEGGNEWNGCVPVCGCGDENESCNSDRICVCKEGFKRDTKGKCAQPEDTTDCATITTCHECSKKPGCNFCASTGTCQSLSGAVCESPLATSTSMCACIGKPARPNEVCSETGWVCKPGFIRTVNGDCVNANNPCLSVKCPAHSTCVNVETATMGWSYTCKCNEGYTLSPNGGCVPVVPDGYCNPFSNAACSDCKEQDGVLYCCYAPRKFDNNGNCVFVCPDNTFVASEDLCDCPEGLVRDSANGRCVKPCTVGETIFSPQDGYCGPKCEYPYVPHPDVSSADTRFKCVIICPNNGNIVDNKEDCYDECDHTQDVYCPCPEGQVREILPTAASAIPRCVDKPDDCIRPLDDGSCPPHECDDGLVPVPVTNAAADQVFRCMKPCDDGTFVAPGEKCPVVCELPLVNDQYDNVCVLPCPDGTRPFNRNCPKPPCDPTKDIAKCCNSNQDTTCGPAPCPEGTVRTHNGCVKLCPETNIPVDDDGNCPSTTCPPGFFMNDQNGQCSIRCPNALGVIVVAQDVSECCKEDQVYIPEKGICVCKNGLLPVEGRCETQCKPPTVLASDGTCKCPDGSDPAVTFCDNKDRCPNGLVLINDVCLCPDGRKPEIFGDRAVCRCDPSNVRSCPLTESNCELAPEYKPCKCLLGNLPKEECNKEPGTCTGDDNLASERCFCKRNPNAASCVRPPVCVVNPALDKCVKEEDCKDSANIGERGCTLEMYCKKNPTSAACHCIRNPKMCSFDGIFVDAGNYADEVDRTCADEDYKDPTKLGCYCRKNFDPKVCYCFDNPNDKRCGVKGSNPTPEPEEDDHCTVLHAVAGRPSCSREKNNSETDDKFTIGLAEVITDVVRDDITITIARNEEDFGTISVSRRGDALGDEDVDDSEIKFDLKLLFLDCFTFFDKDDDGIVDDGEPRSNIIAFKFSKDIKISFDSKNGVYIVIVHYKSDAGTEIIARYIISSGRITFESFDLAPHSVKLSLMVRNFPFDSPTDKLACRMRLDSTFALSTNGNTFNIGDRASFSAEETAIVGGAIVKVKPYRSGNDIYFVVQVPGVSHMIYDPTLSANDKSPKVLKDGGNDEESDSGDASSTFGSVSAVTVCLLALVSFLQI